MPLPETIAIRFTEEDAGYVTVRPVVKQTFRLSELADMVVSVTGKNAARVRQIFHAGSVVYNGYHYWWEGFASEEAEINGILLTFPDDDPALPFDPARVSTISLEIGGGTQRSLVTVKRDEVSAKKLFHKQSPLDVLLAPAKSIPPRYEKYSHADRADLYRLQLSFAASSTLMKQAADASSRGLRKRLTAMQPPAAILFFIPRAKSAQARAAS